MINTVDFSATPVTGVGPQLVSFTDLSVSNEAIVSWLWDFDFESNPGVNTSTDQNPSFTYPEDGGCYTVKLIVNDIDGVADIVKSEYIKLNSSMKFRYRTSLRNYIKDKSVLNRLLKFEEENFDDDLDLYIDMAIGFLNSIPPPVANHTLDNFPMPSLIIHQAAIECLISNGILQSRNDLTYNNGGISVKISDGQRYMAQLQTLTRLVDREIKSYQDSKISANINGGWGGVFSPYAQLTDGSLDPGYLF